MKENSAVGNIMERSVIRRRMSCSNYKRLMDPILLKQTGEECWSFSSVIKIHFGLIRV